jgi:hypothetical protein
MKTLLSAIPAMAFGLCVSAVAGCSTTVDNPSPPPTTVIESTNPTVSTLTVRWTIAGLTDPNECVKSVASNIEISVRDVNGLEVGAFQQTCTAFAASITLNPGAYNATAVLLDGAGQRRTTEVQLAPFTLRGNDELNAQVDFPSDSFL